MLDDSLWSNYSEGEITPQIKYWADLWRERIQRFPKSNFGLKLNSPRLLLLDLLDEVQFNNLRNEKLKSHFSGKIKEWLREKELLSPELNAVFDLLSNSVTSEKSVYVAEICKQGIDGLKNSIGALPHSFSVIEILIEIDKRWSNDRHHGPLL
jgi:hypothetical protein